jgi:xanthine dehydrogenase YagS FAD-binding subunit
MSMLPTFTYVRAKTLPEALQHLASPGARVHAGGTDLLGCLRDRVFAAQKVVSLAALKDLRGVTASATGVRVGALTPIADVAAHKQLNEQYRALAQAAGEVASPQLRNQGTIGGNICQRPRCWYFRGDFHCLRKSGDRCYAVQGQNLYHAIFGGSACFIVHPSDTAPALVALNARVRIQGSAGFRVVPIENFFVLPDKAITKENVLVQGEVVTDILLPPPDPAIKSSYRKVRARGSWDFALTSVALALKFAGGQVAQARIVLGGVAPTPWRLPEVEKLVTGKALTPDVVAAAAAAAVKGAEPLAQNEYKIQMVKGALEESLLALRG